MDERLLRARELWATDPQHPDVIEAWRIIEQRTTDEETQNRALSDSIREHVLAGLACDEVPDAAGELGRCLTNPIPVNGPVGEIPYLSALRTPEGLPFTFHRLGSIDLIDVYEAASLDWKRWELFFLDYYHPRRSRRAPEELTFVNGENGWVMFFGVNWRLSGFPAGICEAVRTATAHYVGIELPSRQLREAIEAGGFERPPEHQARVERLLEEVHAFTG